MEKIVKYTKIIIAFCFISIVFSSCDNWLDVTPEDRLIKENFWKKTEDANKALAAVYDSYRDNSEYSFIMGELRGDLLAITNLATSTTYGGIVVGDISPLNGAISWSGYYSTINLANTFLYFNGQVYDNDKSYTLEMKNAADAEALFLRALNYFYLVRIWKDVPLVLNASISDSCNIYPSISSESVILNQVISDLLIAKDKAYSTKYLGNDRYFRGRANKYSIMALLADVYLWTEQYQKCLDYSDSIINSNFYSILPNDQWFDIYYPGNSDESIFELQFIDDVTGNQKGPFYLMPTKFSSRGALYSNLFPNAVDTRSCKAKTPSFKYFGKNLSSGLRRVNSGEQAPNFLLYRLADIVWFKAEALNELGRYDEALTIVQDMYFRGTGLFMNVNFDYTDKDLLRNKIFEERAKEFVMEGKRWFDILRLGKKNHFENKEAIMSVLEANANDNTITVVKAKDSDTLCYYLPVPYSEIKRNKNLKQNTFYDR
jgi:tetratricopeptide (TPR) repeat protein